MKKRKGLRAESGTMMVNGIRCRRGLRPRNPGLRSSFAGLVCNPPSASEKEAEDNPSDSLIDDGPRLALLSVTGMLATGVGASLDCSSKFEQLRQGMFGFIEGGMDNLGHPVNITDATAMSYDLCVSTCGAGIWDVPGGQSARWLTFSRRFSTWLLPFIAMISQLPFGGDTASAARVLNNLQQSPLDVTRDDSLLFSLIVFPENDEWWSELLVFLDLRHTYTWSFSNVASIIWVVVAFLLTLIDAFTNMPQDPFTPNGLGVGFAWLWILAIITCCLNTGPRCDSTILRDAIRRANRKAYVATHSGQPTLLDFGPNQPAISLDAPLGTVRTDEGRSAPIYNYARLAPWSFSVERVYAAFSAASYRAAHRKYVALDISCAIGLGDEVDLARHRGAAAELAGCIQHVPHAGANVLDGLESRSRHSSLLALLLTWGTIGAAILLEWNNPTRGLACISGSYLIYGLASALIWGMLMLSNRLISRSLLCPPEKTPRWPSLSVKSAIIMRRTAKTLACMNAVWIVLACGLQFAGLYGTCWCTSSALYLGSRAYTVMIWTDSDIHIFWTALWISTGLAWFVPNAPELKLPSDFVPGQSDRCNLCRIQHLYEPVFLKRVGVQLTPRILRSRFTASLVFKPQAEGVQDDRNSQDRGGTHVTAFK
ncbi:hypothetical protein B0H17DRAFT_1127599 [Mycena rosella]|uniref:Uncharacterized protein n=1 Tax=Mycena rosella TaxID=1033263 RepID=A0AAD7DZP9_MYCRO|nr:hypothetical protein B0H17DRAFT_1127599 [Mycena rosella]